MVSPVPHCEECGHDFLIAFSCKGRGICPSCYTRRMAETAAHLADHVIPAVPVRQWVLSLPKRLRWHLHRNPALATTVLELLDRLALLIPPPRRHRHRYHGVFAPNAPLRAQVTALREESPADAPSITDAPDPTEPSTHPPHAYRVQPVARARPFNTRME